ncbi:hypothetical protein LCGC14_2901300, partial [marine sediment metagenome]
MVDDSWVRDVSGSPFIRPIVAGDDLNMLQGDLYTIDPNNTSGTKSYQIVETLTGSVFASEHAKVEFKGLFGGSEKTFMDFTGASNDFNTYAQNWIHTNTTAAISVLEHKVNLNTEGGDGFYFNRVTGKNDAGTPADTVYYRDRAIIGSNTAGSEHGIHAFDVMESGSLIEYLQLNGLTGHTNFRSLQYNFHSVTALDSVQLVAASQQDAAFGL